MVLGLFFLMISTVFKGFSSNFYRISMFSRGFPVIFIGFLGSGLCLLLESGELKGI